MDPAIADLVTNVMAVLMPYVTKGAEEFTRAAGQAAYEKAKSLLATLKARWAGDKEATENLDRFEEKPQRYQPVLEDILKEKLTEDKDLANELAQLLKEIGPTLEVIQKMKEAEDVTGLKAKEMGGTAKVTQEIEKAKKVTGAEIDCIG